MMGPSPNLNPKISPNSMIKQKLNSWAKPMKNESYSIENVNEAINIISRSIIFDVHDLLL